MSAGNEEKGTMLLSAICYCILTVWVVRGYNVDDGNVKYVEKIKTFGNKDQIGYFGYGFSYATNGFRDGEARILVESPRHDGFYNLDKIQADEVYRPEDQLLSCVVDSHYFTSGKSRCLPISPSNQTFFIDGFGSSMAVNKQGIIAACSVNQNLDCGAAKYKPGYCYASSDTGMSWKLFSNKKLLACPIFNVDVVFVLDGSGSIGDSNFERVKDWVLKITEEFDIDGGIVSVGVVQFSHWFKTRPRDDQPLMKTEIELGEFGTYDEFSEAVQNITLHSYTTYTAHALNVTAVNFMNSPRFSDRTTKKVMILLTDGASHDYEYLPYSAEYMRSLEIITYAIGVGLSVTTELRLIATGDTDSSERVYEVDNFPGLMQIVEELQKEILKNLLEGTKSRSSVTFKTLLSQTGFSSTYSKGKRVSGEVNRLQSTVAEFVDNEDIASKQAREIQN